MNLWEPKSLEEYIFPKDKNVLKALFEIAKIRKGEKGINKFLSYGPRGTGKTTLTKLVGSLGFIYQKINASKDRGIDMVREKLSLALTSGSPEPVLIVLDEADYLTPEAQRSLRSLLDDMLDDKIIWFLCNEVSKIIDPLKSRCLSLSHVEFDWDDVWKRVGPISKFDETEAREIWDKIEPDLRAFVRSVTLGIKEECIFSDEAFKELLEDLLKGEDIIKKYWKVPLDYQESLLSLLPEIPIEAASILSEYLFRISQDPKGQKVHFFAAMKELRRFLG